MLWLWFIGEPRLAKWPPLHVCIPGSNLIGFSHSLGVRIQSFCTYIRNVQIIVGGKVVKDPLLHWAANENPAYS